MTDVGTDPATRDEAVLALYDRTIDHVYRYASRLTGGDPGATDDLVQDTYLHLIDQVRRARVEIATIEVGWLIVSCRSRFLDRLRSTRRRAAREERVAQLAAPHPHGRSGTELDGALDGALDGRLVAADALASLSPEHRAALVLRYVDDLPVDAVARALGRSVRATESLLVRARAALRTTQLGAES